MTANECSFNGCDNPRKSKGLCQSHYVQQLRTGVLKPLQVRGRDLLCTFNGCGSVAAAKGLCTGHYGQQRRGVDLKPIARDRPTTCTHTGCQRPVRSRDLCASHYDQYIRGRAVGDYKPRTRGPVTVCSFNGCELPATAKGLCGSHRDQQRRGMKLTQLQPRRKHTVCVVEGCATRATSFTSGEPMCSKHHQRWVKHGDANKLTRDAVRPLGLAAIADSVANRDRSQCWTDWSQLPCWEGLGGWGGKATNGYPMLGEHAVMHLSMEADGRPRPEAPANHGLHSCDTPACWNPAHLRWGTRSDNANDMHKQRNHCQHCAHCNQVEPPDAGQLPLW